MGGTLDEQRFSALVDGLCTVCVSVKAFAGYRAGDDGSEVPGYQLGGELALAPVQTTVRAAAADPDNAYQGHRRSQADPPCPRLADYRRLAVRRRGASITSALPALAGGTGS